MNACSECHAVVVLLCTCNEEVGNVELSRECINSGMNYWNGGILEWNFLKVQYQFLHPNKYNSSLK